MTQKEQVRLEKLKAEFIGKSFSYLTIIDVEIVNKSAWCKCQCKCDSVCSYLLRDVKGNRKKSCGCASSYSEKSKRAKEWAKQNPDKVKAIAEKYKQWCKNNPDKIKEKSDKVSLFYKEHPEKAIENGKKISDWYKNNPDRVYMRTENFKKWCKNNSNQVKIIGKKVSEWSKSNPDKVKQKSNLIKEYIKNNKDKHLNGVKNKIENAKNIRITQLEKLKSNLNFIHKDDLDLLLSGQINTKDFVRTKCPVCGKFDKHIIKQFINVSECYIYKIPLCKKCHLSQVTSKYEGDIELYIKNIYNGECIRNSRNIIPPKELDLYYPEKRVAIEFNGLYWHSEKYKQKDYHLEKFIACKQNGIHLISIFEQDFINNKEKIFSILKNTFCILKQIPARKCECRRLLNYNEKDDFINKYHFSGNSKQGTIAYGLYYNNELVSVMSFGKLRGQNSLRNNPNHYELVRFVTKSGISIIGGASKLFSHFISEYQPKYILSYSDNDFFSGNLYNKLGFTLKSYGTPDYQWCTYKDTLSRSQCMTYKLLEKFPQYNDIQIIGSKENYIMNDLGYVKIYRCGNSIWELYL